MGKGRRKPKMGKSLIKCSICEEVLEEEKAYPCDGCGLGFHQSCLQDINEGEKYLCPSCVEQAQKIDLPNDVPDPEASQDVLKYDPQNEDGSDLKPDWMKQYEAVFGLVGTIKDEMMRQDALEIRKLRRRIYLCEERKKGLSSRIKADMERIDELGLRLSKAILNPQMYIDEVRKSWEEDKMLSSDEDPRQLNIQGEDPKTEGSEKTDEQQTEGSEKTDEQQTEGNEKTDEQQTEGNEDEPTITEEGESQEKSESTEGDEGSPEY